MTGKELLAKVCRTLPRYKSWEDDATVFELDGCVLLTAEEAEKVRRQTLRLSYDARRQPLPDGRIELRPIADETYEALALLTPDGKEET